MYPACSEKEPERITVCDNEPEKEPIALDDSMTWVKVTCNSLSLDDLHIVSSGRNLGDQHLNFAQELVKLEHPD